MFTQDVADKLGIRDQEEGEKSTETEINKKEIIRVKTVKMVSQQNLLRR